jgi:hypothetical protein
MDGVTLEPQSIMRRCHIHNQSDDGVNATQYSVVEDSVFELNGGSGVKTSGTRITIRNNRFMNNGLVAATDVVVGPGTAVVVDNVMNCVGSIQLSGGSVVTSDAGTGSTPDHRNIVLYGAANCAAP